MPAGPQRNFVKAALGLLKPLSLDDFSVECFLSNLPVEQPRSISPDDGGLMPWPALASAKPCRSENVRKDFYMLAARERPRPLLIYWQGASERWRMKPWR